MHNHCAYCDGKFGLIRYRRASKSFCSQTCIDRHKAWLRAQRAKDKRWFDCLWSAGFTVVPCSGARPSA